MAEDSPANLARLREFAKVCIDNQAVQRYIADSLGQLFELTRSRIPAEMQAGEYFYSKFDDNSAGLVSPEDIEAVIAEGNLREKVSAIYWYTKAAGPIFQQFILMRLKQQPLPQAVRPEWCDRHIANIKTICNIDDNKTLIEMFEADPECMTARPNVTPETKECFGSVVTRFPDQDTLLWKTRYVGFPFPTTGYRVKRVDAERALKRPRVSEVYPPLSTRELAWLQKKGWMPSGDPNEQVPWDTGYAYYRMSPDAKHPSHVIFNKFKELEIAGTSGSTDMLMEALSMLPNFNPELTMLASIGFMANPPDHSLAEIIIPALPFGVADFKFDDATLGEMPRSEEYVNRILAKYPNAAASAPPPPTSSLETVPDAEGVEEKGGRRRRRTRRAKRSKRRNVR